MRETDAGYECHDHVGHSPNARCPGDPWYYRVPLGPNRHDQKYNEGPVKTWVKWTLVTIGLIAMVYLIALSFLHQGAECFAATNRVC